MMIEQLIQQWLPTALMLIFGILTYTKQASELKNQVISFEKSKQMKSLKSTVTSLEEQVRTQHQVMIDLKNEAISLKSEICKLREELTQYEQQSDKIRIHTDTEEEIESV